MSNWNLALPQPYEDYTKLFTKGHKLGAGGFGQVFAGTQLNDCVPIAVKQIPKRLADFVDSYDATCRIIKEVRLMRMLNDVTEVPKVLGYFRGEGFYHIVMPRRLGAMDLFALMCVHGRLNDEFALTVLEKIIQVLIQAAKRKAVHRDIKLENILVDESDISVQVIDWGCGAKLRHSNPFTRYDVGGETNLELYPFREFAGTRDYMAPEYWLEHKYWWESLSVWQLGVLLYVMNQDRFPFKSAWESTTEVPPFPKSVDPRVKALIQRCLQKDPKARPGLYELLGATNKLVEGMRQARLCRTFSEFQEGSWDMDEIPLRPAMTI